MVLLVRVLGQVQKTFGLTVGMLRRQDKMGWSCSVTKNCSWGEGRIGWAAAVDWMG